MEIHTLSHDLLVADEESLHPRVRYDEEVIATYSELYTESLETEECPLPPLDVFLVEGRYYIADGFHRLAAARQVQVPTLLCRVHHGTLHDAILFAAEANAHHGLPYSSGDKRRILRRVLTNPDISALSDRAIAKRFGMSHTYVARIRLEEDVYHAFDTELAAQVATVAGSPRGITPAQHGLALLFGLPPQTLRDVQREEWSASNERIRENLMSLVTKSGLSYDDAKINVTQALHGAANRLATRRTRKKYPMHSVAGIGHAGGSQATTTTAPASTSAIQDDGMDAIITGGLDKLKHAWRSATYAARRTFREWVLTQPIEAYGPVTSSEQTQRYSSVIANIYKMDSVP